MRRPPRGPWPFAVRSREGLERAPHSGDGPGPRAPTKASSPPEQPGLAGRTPGPRAAGGSSRRGAERAWEPARAPRPRPPHRDRPLLLGTAQPREGTQTQRGQAGRQPRARHPPTRDGHTAGHREQTADAPPPASSEGETHLWSPALPRCGRTGWGPGGGLQGVDPAVVAWTVSLVTADGVYTATYVLSCISVICKRENNVAG